MLKDKFGRRLIQVPWKKARAELLLCDASDRNFWQELAELLGQTQNLKDTLGLETDLNATSTEPQEMWAEVFAHDYGLFSLGSSRHLEAGRFMWKGVGKNQLALRTDWLHSWGGMGFEEGVEEFVLSQRLRSTGAVVAVKALLVYEQLSVPRRFLLLRDMTLPRLVSTSTKFNVDENFRRLANTYGKVLEEEGVQAWIALLERQVRLMKAGWAPASPSIGNYDVAGRTLDMTGGRLFEGLGVEFCYYDPTAALVRHSSPLTSTEWIIKNGWAPLHSKMWSIDESKLLRLAQDYLREQSLYLRVDERDRGRMVAEKIASGEWSKIKNNWYACTRDTSQVRDVAAQLKKFQFELADLTDRASWTRVLAPLLQTLPPADPAALKLLGLAP